MTLITSASPGVTVNIIDQSQYLPPQSSSVPFILLATAQNKSEPSGVGIAPGTLKANADTLYQVTSQRDLSNLYGTPIFYTSTNGTPLNGYELNEYGLFAAYSLLGSTSACWTLRADIDLQELIGSTQRPKAPPANGTYWLDTTNSTWGIFQFNASTGNFTNVIPTIYTSDSDLDSTGTPLSSVGNIGDYAVVQAPGFLYEITTDFSTYYYKNQENTWVPVGGGLWKASWPTVQGSVYVAPSAVVTFTITTPQGGTFTVTVSTGSDVNAAASAINNQNIPFVTASVLNSKLVIYSSQPDDYLSTTQADLTITPVSGSSGLAGLGLVAGPYYQPAVVWAPNSQQPRWRSSDARPHPTGSVFIKTNAANSGSNLIVSEYLTSAGSWSTSSAPWYTSDAAASAAFDSLGGLNIPAGTLYTQYDGGYDPVQIWRRAAKGPAVFTGTNAYPTFTVGSAGGEQLLVRWSVPGEGVDTEFVTVEVAGQGSATDFVTAWSQATAVAPYVTATTNTAGQVVLSHTLGGTITLEDSTVRGVQSITIPAGQGGVYTNGTNVPLVTIGLPQLVNTQATASAVITTVGSSLNGSITAINISNPGNGYQTVPNISISAPDGVGGVQATATAQIFQGSVVAINVTNPGSGYSSNQVVQVTLSAPTGTTRATAQAALGNSGGVISVGVSQAGSGYDVPPNVVFTPQAGDFGAGAAAVATIDLAGTVTGVTMTAYGSGYSVPPAVSFTLAGSTGSGAQGTAALGFTITNITVTNPGAGYNVAPSQGNGGITISGGNLLEPSLLPFGVYGTLSAGVVSKLGFSSVANGGTNGSIKNASGANRTYSNVTAIGGLGTGATFTVSTVGDSYFVKVSNAGSGYQRGDLLTLNALQVFSEASDPLTVRVTGTSNLPSAGTITTVIVASGSAVVPQDNLLSNWQSFFYIANAGAPAIDPANGAYWYYSTISQVDIMIRDNESSTGWAGYKLVTNDSRGYNLTLTNPTGPIIAASAPTQQTDGSPLEYGDLWVDVSPANVINYPVISRWENPNGNPQWVLIDNADSTDSNGILFADARWAPNGTTNPIDDPIPSITSLLVSNYLDLDAPDPFLYPEGTLLFNTRRSGDNIKQFEVNYFNSTTYPDSVLPQETNAWVTASGNQSNGAPYMGRYAQRIMVVNAMKSAIANNSDLLEEDRFFNLMATPNYPELQIDMITLNAARGFTSYIIGDTPLRLPANSQDIINWATNKAGATVTNDFGLVSVSEYMGLYYPSGTATAPDGTTVVVPPSFMILNTMLYNDTVAYPWFAPAGTQRGQIQNASAIGYLDATTSEFIVIRNSKPLRDTLYTYNINPIANFVGTYGLINYGNKNSRDTQSALNRTNVARLINFIRNRLYTLCKPYVFQPNDTTTRNQIRGTVQQLMAQILSNRGLYDYLVVCDQSNNTPAIIDANELVVDVAIEPVKAVEFIYVPVRVLNTGEIAALGQSGATSGGAA